MSSYVCASERSSCIYLPRIDLASVPVADNAFAPEFSDYDHTTDDDGDSTSIENNGGPSGDTFMVLNVASSKTDVNDEWDVLLP